MAMALAEPTLTPDEYLQLERGAERRSEYFAGSLYAMAGASENHVLLVGQLVRLLGNQFVGRPCKVYSTDMRVKVSRTGLYTYPDVVALCGDGAFEDENRDTLLNPSLVIEVLSPSTEAHDRGAKFAHYRRLDSVLDYLLVSQDRMRIERYSRHSGGLWLYSEHSAPDAIVTIETLKCELVLEDVYDKATLPLRDPREP